MNINFQNFQELRGFAALSMRLSGTASSSRADQASTQQNYQSQYQKESQAPHGQMAEGFLAQLLQNWESPSGGRPSDSLAGGLRESAPNPSSASGGKTAQGSQDQTPAAGYAAKGTYDPNWTQKVNKAQELGTGCPSNTSMVQNADGTVTLTYHDGSGGVFTGADTWNPAPGFVPSGPPPDPNAAPAGCHSPAGMADPANKSWVDNALAYASTLPAPAQYTYLKSDPYLENTARQRGIEVGGDPNWLNDMSYGNYTNGASWDSKTMTAMADTGQPLMSYFPSPDTWPTDPSQRATTASLI